MFVFLIFLTLSDDVDPGQSSGAGAGTALVLVSAVSSYPPHLQTGHEHALFIWHQLLIRVLSTKKLGNLGVGGGEWWHWKVSMQQVLLCPLSSISSSLVLFLQCRLCRWAPVWSRYSRRYLVPHLCWWWWLRQRQQLLFIRTVYLGTSWMYQEEFDVQPCVLPTTLRMMILLLVVWLRPDTWHSYSPASSGLTSLIINTNSDHSSPTMAFTLESSELLKLLRAINCGIGVVCFIQETWVNEEYESRLNSLLCRQVPHLHSWVWHWYCL